MADTISTSGQLRCVVVTPEQTVLETASTFVVLPLFDGEIGIAPKHSPLIGRLGYGEMRITRDGKTDHFYVDGGFVQVASDVVTVLTNRAAPVSALDAASAAIQLEEARAMSAKTAAELEIRTRRMAQARAQIRLAGKANSTGAHH